MGDGPPRFRRNFTCSAVLRIHSRENEVSTTGCYPLRRTFRSLRLPRSFVTPYRMSQPQEASLLVWLCSVSLAATQEIAFAFSSSVLRCFSSRVCLPYPMYSGRIPYHYVWWVSPFGNLGSYLQLPKHIGVSPVLHRLLVSRHPPCALSNLTKLKIKNMSYTVI